MTNKIISAYIERKVEGIELLKTLVHEQDSMYPSEYIEPWRVKEFLSDMAQEIFSALPNRENPVSWLDTQEITEDNIPLLEHFKGGFNTCRSTFLENIKKLTP